MVVVVVRFGLFPDTFLQEERAGIETAVLISRIPGISPCPMNRARGMGVGWAWVLNI